jgi:hypothetical protein
MVEPAVRGEFAGGDHKRIVMAPFRAGILDDAVNRRGGAGAQEEQDAQTNNAEDDAAE